jgi:hypothetical protein
MWQQLRDVDPATRMVAVDLAVPALVELGNQGFEQFWQVTHRLVTADDKVDLFEWMLGSLLRRHVMGALGHHQPTAQTRSIAQSLEPLSIVLSALIHAGNASREGGSTETTTPGSWSGGGSGGGGATSGGAWGAAQQALGGVKGLEFRVMERLDLQAIDEALRELSRLRSVEQRRVIEACAACVSADRQVTVQEGQLLRLTADAIGVPMPPMLPGQRL